MDLLGGYASDSSSSVNDEKEVATKPQQEPSLTPAARATPRILASAPSITAGNGIKRKIVNYNELPMSRPLKLDGLGEDEVPKMAGEPALKRAMDLDAGRMLPGRSLVASLPAPKVTLGSESSQSSAVRIDLSGLGRLKNKQHQKFVDVAGLIHKEIDHDVEEEEVRENFQNHSMFNEGSQTGCSNGPTREELDEMRSVRNFTKIQADDMKDPNWYMTNQIAGGPGLHKGKKVPAEISSYDSNHWHGTTHANPSRIQKRKHQINWLANEAMEKEAELLDRNVSNKLTKAQTQMKYGW